MRRIYVGDKIQYRGKVSIAETPHPVINVVDEVDGMFILETQAGWHFARPVTTVDRDFKVVKVAWWT